MSFKPEITLGTVIELAVFLFAVLGAVRKFGVLEAKLNIMYGWFEASVMHTSRARDKQDDESFFKK